MTPIYNVIFQTLTIAFIAVSVISCSGGSSGSSGGDDSTSSILNADAGAPTADVGDCDANTSGVNWNALMDINCPNLSDYNLFKNEISAYKKLTLL